MSDITFEDIAPFVRETFILASGPGGQNVNKVSSAVQLQLDVAACTAISEGDRARILRKLDSRLTKDDRLIVKAQDARSQDRNRAEARKRMLALLNTAKKRQKFRVPTKPSLASKRRRMDAKKKRGDVKKSRGRVKFD